MNENTINVIAILTYLLPLFLLVSYKYIKENEFNAIFVCTYHLIIAPFILIYLFIFEYFLILWIYYPIFSLFILIIIITNFDKIKRLKFQYNQDSIIYISISLFFLLAMFSSTIIFSGSINFLIVIMGSLSWFTDTFAMILNDSSTKINLSLMFMGSLSYIVGYSDNNTSLVGMSRYLLYGVPSLSLMNSFFNNSLRETLTQSTLNAIMLDTIMCLIIYVTLQLIFYMMVLTIIEKFLGLLKHT